MDKEHIEPQDCGLTGKTFTQPSLCHSEFAVDCDLKTIIKRFMNQGLLPPNVGGFSADVTMMPDSFDEMQINSVRIRQHFEQLPIEEQNKFESAEDWYLSTLQDASTPEPTPGSTPAPTTAPTTAPTSGSTPGSTP